jgi:hypothetical protein
MGGAALKSDRSDDQQLVLVLTRRHDRFARREIHVDLAAHADLARDVDAGLDRERYAGHEQPFLSRLEIVEMWPRTVQIARVDRVPGTVREILAVAALLDHRARRIVHVGPAEWLVRLCLGAHERDRGVARVAHRIPDRARLC